MACGRFAAIPNVILIMSEFGQKRLHCLVAQLSDPWTTGGLHARPFLLIVEQIVLGNCVNQSVQYCTTADGAKIAFSVVGKGTPIVRTSHWLTHLEHDLKSPVWRHVIMGLAQHHQLVRYDARGEGMSDRSRIDVGFDTWMPDLEAVVDELNLHRFALFGCSQGAATAIAYAVKHPHRVSHLILYGGFAQGTRSWGSHEKAEEELALTRALVRQGWGKDHPSHRQWFTSRFIPDGTAEQYRWFNDMQRASATPEMAERHLVAVAELDVTPLLSQVTTPTLVLHSRGDAVAPFERGEELATKITGARLVPLEGNCHLFLAGTSAHRDFLTAVASFLGDPEPGATLPGTKTFEERLHEIVTKVEQNWMIKIAVLVGAMIGLVASARELWKLIGS
jgi:pimeloyl-ACP methyl ester carboxylesterase